MTPRWPDTFVVGAPRCGTTTLHEYLRQHPEVYMSPRKEPLFFATDLPGLPGPRISTPEDYAALFSGAADGQRVGEASPYYLYSARAADAIGRQCPDARIIVMLRNPADMMYSMYWAWSYAGFDAARSFEEAISRAPEGRDSGGRFILGYRHLARYAEHVERYLDTFGRSRVHAIVFDDLARDPAGVYRDLCRFLDVSIDHRPRLALSAFRRAASRRPFSVPFARFVTSAWPGSRGPVGRRVAALARDTVRRFGSVPPPPMSPELRQRLLREYQPDVRRLEHLIDRDLSAWRA